MATAAGGLESLRPLRKAINAALSLPAISLEQAAQNVVRTLYEEFKGSVILARIFVTVPCLQLPATLRLVVQKVAAGAAHAVTDETPVLTLIGTYGTQASWRDCRLSKGHAGIPLSSPSFIGSMPMVSRLLNELGIDIGAFDQEDRRTFVDLGLFMSGAFYVEDAATTTDRWNRRVIPAQDFVASHGVRTVFGGGAAYPASGTILTLVLFTSERLPMTIKQNALIAINELRALTQHFISSQRIFS